MKTYSLWTLLQMREYLKNPPLETKPEEGFWWPAKPVRYISKWNDLKLAWLVFTHKAEAITWLDIHTREDL